MRASRGPNAIPAHTSYVALVRGYVNMIPRADPILDGKIIPHILDYNTHNIRTRPIQVPHSLTGGKL